ncbi:Glycosyltransferase involved in cell wall bisynthesis [Roseivivax halotolerans]|uniref:Glycosyltransferase involved in cell wall bisynthesis n=2 Tax=Roseivivax halotolerans TaxID=93684 RepID=A0A1I5YFY3_9RHOB|nr:Glycosyltransferase involved in cell wall bisynthesis [Roseivivax halotolerans]
MEGAQVMLARLLRQGLDPDPVVVSLRGVSDDARKRAGGHDIRYYPLGMTGLSRVPNGLWTLARILRRERPEAILCWMYHAALLGLLAGFLFGPRPRVYWTIRQSLDDPQAFGRTLRLTVRAASVFSRFCDGIIYNSRRALVQHGKAGFHNDIAVVIPNGIEMPAHPNHKARVPRVFGIAARHHAQKDHPTFLRAAARLLGRVPDAKFVAAGHGMTCENQELAQQIRAADLDPQSIELLGPLTDMDPFYRAIDVLVLSSRTEGFPNVVAEAMSYGIPVVTTNVGDAATIVGNTGEAVPPGDDRAVAEAMARMCGFEPAAYAELSRRAARQIRENYELAAIAARYQSVLDADRLETPVWHRC